MSAGGSRSNSSGIARTPAPRFARIARRTRLQSIGYCWSTPTQLLADRKVPSENYGSQTHSNCRRGGGGPEIAGGPQSENSLDQSPDLCLRRQRMGNEGAGDRHEPQSLDLALRLQHPVERIAGSRLRFDRSNRVTFVDRDDRYAQAVNKLGQGDEIPRHAELAQSEFDGDLPKAARAQMVLVALVAQQSCAMVRQAGRPMLMRRGARGAGENPPEADRRNRRR